MDPTAGRRRVRCDDSGAAILETALVSPLVFLLVFAILEFGLVFRDHLTITDGTTDAARTGAVIGPELRAAGEGGEAATADYHMVERFRRASGTLPPDWLDRIVIFKARAPAFGGPDEQLPEACKTGDGVPDVCNVYDAFDAYTAIEDGQIDYFRCIDGAGAACNWDPTRRQNGPLPEDIDYLGVWIKVDRPYLTGIFGEKFTVTSGLITRLEPGSDHQ